MLISQLHQLGISPFPHHSTIISFWKESEIIIILYFKRQIIQN